MQKGEKKKKMEAIGTIVLVCVLGLMIVGGMANW